MRYKGKIAIREGMAFYLEKAFKRYKVFLIILD